MTSEVIYQISEMNPNSKPSLQTVHVIHNQRNLTAYIRDDSIHCNDPICSIEIWNGELRVLAWKEDCDEPAITTIKRIEQ